MSHIKEKFLSFHCNRLDFCLGGQETEILDDRILFCNSLGDLLCCLDTEFLEAHLVVVVQARLDLSLRFQTANDAFVLPANFAGDTTDLAVSTVRAEAEDLHCRWNADALLFVVGWWNALEHL